jgi:hypothetical protein
MAAYDSYREQTAYLAGVFDGEGCISLHRQISRQGRPVYLLYVSVSMCDPQAIKLFCERFGGKISIDNRRYSRGNPNHRIIYRWTITGRKALPLIEELDAFIRVKRQQFDLIKKYVVNVGVGERGRRLSSNDKDFQAVIYRQLKDAKKVTYEAV